MARILSFEVNMATPTLKKLETPLSGIIRSLIPAFASAILATVGAVVGVNTTIGKMEATLSSLTDSNKILSAKVEKLSESNADLFKNYHLPTRMEWDQLITGTAIIRSHHEEIRENISKLNSLAHTHNGK